MIELVIAGGQTGADQAGWRAARAAGIPTGGWMPRDFMTEDGPRPEFAELYGAVEHASPAYPPRTRANVGLADATIIFDTSRGRSLESLSRGTQLAIRAAMDYEKPSIVAVVELGRPIEPRRTEAMARRLAGLNARSVNVGGNRESKARGIGAWVEEYLSAVFAAMRSPATTKE